MKNQDIYFRAGELAKIHGLNKRTLHFYDEIGVFSPALKGENGYRYYSFEQSLELENILTLRELGMSLEEIKRYLSHPNPEDFCSLATDRIIEIDKTIHRLKQLKSILQQKKDSLIKCNGIIHGKIEIVDLPEQYLLLTPLDISYVTHSSLISDVDNILSHLRCTVNASGYRKNCGSYISLEKIKKNDFQFYDGIFTQMDIKRKNFFVKPAGKYLRGFSVGDWDNIPDVYKSMLAFAEKNDMKLSGYAYECGLNEFAISGEEEYITQIEVMFEK